MSIVLALEEELQVCQVCEVVFLVAALPEVPVEAHIDYTMLQEQLED